MLATVAMGNTAAGMATKLPKLPGAGQVAVVAEANANTPSRTPSAQQGLDVV
jgi:hypothetical protein